MHVEERDWVSDEHDAPEGAEAAYRVRYSYFAPPEGFDGDVHPAVHEVAEYEPDQPDHEPYEPLEHVDERVCVSDEHAPAGVDAAYRVRLSLLVPPCGLDGDVQPAVHDVLVYDPDQGPHGVHAPDEQSRSRVWYSDWQSPAGYSAAYAVRPWMSYSPSTAVGS